MPAGTASGHAEQWPRPSRRLLPMPPRRDLTRFWFHGNVLSSSDRKARHGCLCPGARPHGFLIYRTAGIKMMKSFSAWSRPGSEFLTKEIFPGLTPCVRWAKTPLGSLGLAGAASALCGSFLHQQGFVVLFAVEEGDRDETREYVDLVN